MLAVTCQPNCGCGCANWKRDPGGARYQEKRLDLVAFGAAIHDDTEECVLKLGESSNPAAGHTSRHRLVGRVVYQCNAPI